MSTIHIPGTNTDIQVRREPTLLSSILAIVFIAFLIAIVLWGLVHLISLIRGTKDPINLASWFTPKPSLIIHAPKEVTSGSVTSITWDFKPTTPGSYTFSYECTDGVTVYSVSAAGQQGTSLPCSTAVTASTTKNSISVLPVSHIVKDASVSLSIFFVPDDGSTPREGTAHMLVHSQTAKATTTAVIEDAKPVVAENASTSHSAQVAKTPADLSVRIVAVGVIDPSTAQFVERMPNSLDDMMAVQFDIANKGGAASGSWYFEADLPTLNGYHYVSPTQASLAPDGHILNTLRFTQVASGGGTFNVTVHKTGEANTSNNNASVIVQGAQYQ